MNLNNFTIKAQEAVAAAQQLAFNAQHQYIDTAHLLKAMLDSDDNSIEFLLKKNDVNVGFVEQKLNEQIQKMPKVGSGFAELISGTNPDKQNFPMRNRIVAGLADATIVIETDIKGGSMITANLANGYNREVLAYPGSIYSNASSGCHQLIKTLKANIITDANDIVELLNWDTTTKKAKPTQRELFIELSADEKVIYNLLSAHEQLSIDEITFGSKLNPSQIAAAILGLEMQNIITMLPGKIYKIY